MTKPSAVARDAAFRVERRLDQPALISQAMFELFRETNGLTDDQLKKKISRSTVMSG